MTVRYFDDSNREQVQRSIDDRVLNNEHTRKIPAGPIVDRAETKTREHAAWVVTGTRTGSEA
jgi:hypothetical protein